MEEQQNKIDRNEYKNIVLIGKCGKCKREYTAEAVLPTVTIEDEAGNLYRDKATPHLITLCPHCFGLLNLAKRIETNKQRV